MTSRYRIEASDASSRAERGTIAIVHVEQVLTRFSKLQQEGLRCELLAGASGETIGQTETRLGLALSNQVVQFWSAINGLSVQDPPFWLAPLSEFRVREGLLLFGGCEKDVELAFDTRTINVAGQWSIVNAATGYQITYTMASFWSSHMWTWLLRNKRHNARWRD